jgi:hypothetical protein
MIFRPERVVALALALCAGLAGCSMSDKTPSPAPAQASEPAALMKWPDLLERPRPEPSETISYGDKGMQRVDLWLPSGKGPHPTVLMVHGGCWQTEIADRRIMNWIADDLRTRGIAVWNIDYRGVDREGGGYPGPSPMPRPRPTRSGSTRRAATSTSLRWWRSAIRRGVTSLCGLPPAIPPPPRHPTRSSRAAARCFRPIPSALAP